MVLVQEMVVLNDGVLDKIIAIRDKLDELSCVEFLQCNNDFLLINDKVVDENLLYDFDINIQKNINEINNDVLPRIK